MRMQWLDSDSHNLIQQDTNLNNYAKFNDKERSWTQLDTDLNYLLKHRFLDTHFAYLRLHTHTHTHTVYYTHTHNILHTYNILHTQYNTHTQNI